MGGVGALDRIRTCDLCLRRAALYPLSYERGLLSNLTELVPKEGLEPTRANAHYALNVARLPVSPLRRLSPRDAPSAARTLRFLVGDAGLEPAASRM